MGGRGSKSASGKASKVEQSINDALKKYGTKKIGKYDFSNASDAEMAKLAKKVNSALDGMAKKYGFLVDETEELKYGNSKEAWHNVPNSADVYIRPANVALSKNFRITVVSPKESGPSNFSYNEKVFSDFESAFKFADKEVKRLTKQEQQRRKAYQK